MSSTARPEDHSDGVTIRPAVLDDAEALGQLHVDSWDESYAHLVPEKVRADREEHLAERIEVWREMVALHDRTLVAEAPEGLVGFAGAGEPDELGLPLLALYVRAHWWGTGLGHLLFEATIGGAPSYLWVLEPNKRAIRFYENHGYHPDGAFEQAEEGLHIRMVRP